MRFLETVLIEAEHAWPVGALPQCNLRLRTNRTSAVCPYRLLLSAFVLLRPKAGIVFTVRALRTRFSGLAPAVVRLRLLDQVLNPFRGDERCLIIAHP